MFRQLIGSLLSVHEGHGHGSPGEGETWWHYFSEPEHLPLTIATILAATLLVVGTLSLLNRFVKRKQMSRNKAC